MVVCHIEVLISWSIGNKNVNFCVCFWCVLNCWTSNIQCLIQVCSFDLCCEWWLAWTGQRAVLYGGSQSSAGIYKPASFVPRKPNRRSQVWNICCRAPIERLNCACWWCGYPCRRLQTGPSASWIKDAANEMVLRTVQLTGVLEVQKLGLHFSWNGGREYNASLNPSTATETLYTVMIGVSFLHLAGDNSINGESTASSVVHEDSGKATS